jgi:hypothetical protein
MTRFEGVGVDVGVVLPDTSVGEGVAPDVSGVLVAAAAAVVEVGAAVGFGGVDVVSVPPVRSQAVSNSMSNETASAPKGLQGNVG